MRETHFIRLTAEGRDVYLLGTIHGDHLSSSAYSLAHLQAVIANLKPDLLLLESRPEELAKGNWGDGPIEMPVASLTARDLGIPVAGIDWWQKSSSKPGTTDPDRDDRMAQNVLSQLPGHSSVLILVGYSHVAELRTRLAAAGFSEERFDRNRKGELFSTGGRFAKFPPGLKSTLEKCITLLEAERREETDTEWRAAFERGLTLRRAFRERVESIGERPPSSTAEGAAVSTPQ
jgi:hypothetical protein